MPACAIESAIGGFGSSLLEQKRNCSAWDSFGRRDCTAFESLASNDFSQTQASKDPGLRWRFPFLDGHRIEGVGQRLGPGGGKTLRPFPFRGAKCAEQTGHSKSI